MNKLAPYVTDNPLLYLLPNSKSRNKKTRAKSRENPALISFILLLI